MIIENLNEYNSKGVIDRIEEGIAVVETEGGFLPIKKAMFPFTPQEGMHFSIKNGRISLEPVEFDNNVSK